MVANIEADEKLVALATELFVKNQKVWFFTCFYIRILFQTAQSYSTKRDVLFYYKTTHKKNSNK